MRLGKLCGWCLAGAVALLAAPLGAQVTMPKIFTDHMMLQREAPVHVWGWAPHGQKVTANFRGETAGDTADVSGRWDVYFAPGSAGGPFTLEIEGGNQLKIQDILVGDIWVASGQSNMEMPVSGWDAGPAGGKAAPMKDSAKEIAAANYPQIRLLHLNKQQSIYPMDDAVILRGWEACSPETVGHISAAAYFFARDVQAKTKVPMGIIHTTWGGTQGAAWVSTQALMADANLLPVLADYDARFLNRASELRQVEQEKIEAAVAKKEGKPAARSRVRMFPESWRPGGLYNGMIAPLTPLRIKGFLWYQGESDWEVLGGRSYGRLLTALIGDWRRAWAQGDLPFLYVQTASYGAPPLGWPPVREGQRRVLSVANTGMAVTTDIGETNNVHPANKQDVGARLALIALAKVYGQAVEYSGPAYRQTTRECNALRVWFDHAQGMKAKSGTVESFEVAGADHQFVAAKGEIRGDSVLVSSPQVSDPVYVRYAWRSDPVLSLYNSADLPASPFTSEDTY